MSESIKRSAVLPVLMAACLLLNASAVSAQGPPSPPIAVVLIPPGFSGALRLQPGESATLTYAVENKRPYALGNVSIRTRYFGGPAALSEFTFVTEPGSRCGAIVPGANLTINYLDLGETVICRTEVTRSLSSLNDIRVSFCAALCEFPSGAFEELVYLGALPDLELTGTIVDALAGAATAIVQVTATNRSNRPMAQQVVESQCLEFNGGFFAPAPFRIENDFPGACPTTQPSQFCGNFTGQAFSNVGFSIGPISAGGRASCNLRLRFLQPLTRLVSITMKVTNTTHNYVDGTIGYDPNLANNSTAIGAAPYVPYVYKPVPTLRRELLALLTILLVGASALHARPKSRGS